MCLGENKCKDVNECELETHNCWGGGICRNTWGSFKCRCPGTILLFFKIKAVIFFGYFIISFKSLKDGFSGDGYSCEDENECKTGSHDCHELALCENTLGSFKCTCKKGTHGNGQFCDHDIGPDQFFDFQDSEKGVDFDVINQIFIFEFSLETYNSLKKRVLHP